MEGNIFALFLYSWNVYIKHNNKIIITKQILKSKKVSYSVAIPPTKFIHPQLVKNPKTNMAA